MPHTLLLADDSVTIQRVIELTFAEEDVQVVAVSDGDQAIERLEKAPPDIVLADIGMPGRNGYEVARYIRQSPKLAHIPVVLLTGAFEPVDQVRADEVGCDGVLAKPFEPQLVIGRVKELLSSHQRRAAAPLDANLAPPPSASAEQWTPPLADQPFRTAPPPQADTAAALDDYFDRLDSAFANLSKRTAAPANKLPTGLQPPAPSAPNTTAPSTLSLGDQIDWFTSHAPAQPSMEQPSGAQPSPEPQWSDDVPLSYASPQSAFESPADAAKPPTVDAPPPVVAPASPSAPPPIAAPPTATLPVVTTPPTAVTPPAVAPPSTSAAVAVSLPSIADAFAAILAAEQYEGVPAARPEWPSPSAPPAAAPSPAPAVELSDDIVERITARVLERLSDQVIRDTVSDIVSQVAERLVREEIERIKSSIK